MGISCVTYLFECSQNELVCVAELDRPCTPATLCHCCARSGQCWQAAALRAEARCAATSAILAQPACATLPGMPPDARSLGMLHNSPKSCTICHTWACCRPADLQTLLLRLPLTWPCTHRRAPSSTWSNSACCAGRSRAAPPAAPGQAVDQAAPRPGRLPAPRAAPVRAGHLHPRGPRLRCRDGPPD